MRRAFSGLVALGVVPLALLSADVSATRSPDGVLAPDTLDDWRFPVGERMTYSVSWGAARIGSASLAVEAIDTVAGLGAYRTSLKMDAGPPFYKLRDELTSWIRPRPFATLQFDQKLRQGGYHRDRRSVMDVEGLTYTRFDLSDGEYVMDDELVDIEIPAGALDEVAYFYFARLSDLEIGRRYEYERYFKKSGNPVVLEVLRREEIRVPAGKFNTIVVRPIIKTSGMFGEGGEAELYLSDDERRIPVRIKTKMPFGSGNLYLTEYEPGEAGALIDPSEPGPAEAAAGGP